LRHVHRVPFLNERSQRPSGCPNVIGRPRCDDQYLARPLSDT
jgi:hypothetical protein